MFPDRKPKVVVIGGAVIDLLFPVRELPQWKQAVQARSFDTYPGGKGLIQAVAAARLGAEVHLISAVGEDDFGKRILQFLDINRVNRDFVMISSDQATDVTGVFVNDQGEAAFVGWKGTTTSQIDIDLVSSATRKIMEADALLLTLEVQTAVLSEAIRIASTNNIWVTLNPAPPLDSLDPPPYDLIPNVTLLVPNLWEAACLLRMDDYSNPRSLASQLGRLGAKHTCITTSEAGCIIVSNNRLREYPALFVGRPVDTTGGSDAFCAMLTLLLTSGRVDFDDAMAMANAAAAIAVSRRGGAPAMPTLPEVMHLLDRQGVSIPQL